MCFRAEMNLEMCNKVTSLNLINMNINKTQIRLNDNNIKNTNCYPNLNEINFYMLEICEWRIFSHNAKQILNYADKTTRITVCFAVTSKNNFRISSLKLYIFIVPKFLHGIASYLVFKSKIYRRIQI